MAMKILTDSPAIAELHPRITKSPIEGVVVRELSAIVDGRGDLTEVWSESWKLHGLVRPRHVYQSATDYGVVKAWHLHRKHTDQFVVTRGKIQIVCVDCRPESKSFGRANSFIAGNRKPMMIVIPPGILHGWKALSVPEALVLNLQSHPYDPRDEVRVPWDAVLATVWEPHFR
jgi:dTDP-4-dehydrorhamnose 3,5-epimerase